MTASTDDDTPPPLRDSAESRLLWLAPPVELRTLLRSAEPAGNNRQEQATSVT